MKTKINDVVLIKQYKNGDLSAFDKIILSYNKDIKFHIFNLIKDYEKTNDIFQETFIKAFKAINSDKYQESGSLKSWLIRIAHNLCVDYLRKNNKHLKNNISINEEGLDHDLLLEQYSEKSPEDILLDRESDYNIQDLINILPPEQKEVVLLRHFQDFSFSEIAQYTGVSINTCLGRMRYALNNLRKEIERIKNTGTKILK